jgi:hypothetical protein
MTTETTEPTTETAAPITETAAAEKANSFLGLYFPTKLKSQVAEAAKAERRSMSQYAVMVFEKHFATA